MKQINVTLSVQTLSMLSGLLLPLLVSLLTKLHAPSWVKAMTNFVLAGATAFLATAQANHGHVELVLFARGFLTSFVSSTAIYHGLYKPTGITDAVSDKTAGFGVGTPAPDAGVSSEIGD